MDVMTPPSAQAPVVAHAAHRVRAPRAPGVRDLLKTLHRILGLAAGVLLVVSGLTGSALVFRAEIDTALNPGLLRVVPAAQRASLADILDDVARSYPGAPPARVRMPRSPEGTYEVWLGTAPERYVYADPYRDGRLLGAREPKEFLTGWLFLLHSHLLSGEAGNVVAGVGALVLVVLSLSGLVMWWPRGSPWRAWQRWRAAITIGGESGSSRRLYDLHRAIGFYASALLLLAGVTGASLVFHESLERASYWITVSSPLKAVVATPARESATEQRHLPVDSLLAIATRTQPNGVPSYLYLPVAPGENFRLRQRLPGETHPNGKSFVHIEPTTGRVVGVEDGAAAPRGSRLFSMLYPLHIGIVGGGATRLLSVATGLSLPVLAVSGVLMWWRRRRRLSRPATAGRAVTRGA